MKLYTPNNHIVVEIEEEYFIVDTGAPFSFGYNGKENILINGQQYKLSDSVICDKSVVDSLTEMDISGFIGLDIIKKTNLTIDYENNEIFFSSDAIKNDNSSFLELEMNFLMGNYIIVEGIIIGEALRNTIIDTGARTSYVASWVLDSLIETDISYSDESPEIGHIEGNYYKGDLSFSADENSEHSHEVMVGQLPGLYAMLEMVGVDGIIGTDMLSNKIVIFDFENEVIFLK